MHKIECRYQQFDIIPEIEQVAIASFDRAQIKQVDIQLHLSPAKIMVNLDKIFLRYILSNLLFDVIRFIQNGSVLSIHAADSEGMCIIEIINNATPIGKAQLDQYFNRLTVPDLFALANTQSGRGFSIAEKLTVEMDGVLTYKTELAIGNYFKLKFKLA
jgi:signal transduction histidine kinase